MDCAFDLLIVVLTCWLLCLTVCWVWVCWMTFICVCFGWAGCLIVLLFLLFDCMSLVLGFVMLSIGVWVDYACLLLFLYWILLSLFVVWLVNSVALL